MVPLFLDICLVCGLGLDIIAILSDWSRSIVEAFLTDRGCDSLKA